LGERPRLLQKRDAIRCLLIARGRAGRDSVARQIEVWE